MPNFSFQVSCMFLWMCVVLWWKENWIFGRLTRILSKHVAGHHTGQENFSPSPIKCSKHQSDLWGGYLNFCPCHRSVNPGQTLQNQLDVFRAANCALCLLGKSHGVQGQLRSENESPETFFAIMSLCAELFWILTAEDNICSQETRVSWFLFVATSISRHMQTFLRLSSANSWTIKRVSQNWTKVWLRNWQNWRPWNMCRAGKRSKWKSGSYLIIQGLQNWLWYCNSCSFAIQLKLGQSEKNWELNVHLKLPPFSDLRDNIICFRVGVHHGFHTGDDSSDASLRERDNAVWRQRRCWNCTDAKNRTGQSFSPTFCARAIHVQMHLESLSLKKKNNCRK